MIVMAMVLRPWARYLSVDTGTGNGESFKSIRRADAPLCALECEKVPHVNQGVVSTSGENNGRGIV